MLSYERYMKLAGGRNAVAALLDRQAAKLGASMDDDEALAIANAELHAMRRERDGA